MSTLDAALSYLARGWGVVPLWPIVERDGALRCACVRGAACERPGKHPGVPLVERFDDPSKVVELWEASRRNSGVEPGVAVATGRGLMVVDIDPRHGGDAAWEAFIAGREAEVSETLRVTTGGGGEHYYFSVEGRAPCSVGRVAPGVDIRGDGGYVVAPPTLHASGARYALAGGVWGPVLPAPAWLLDAARGRVRPARVARARRDGGAAAVVAHVDAPDTIPEGGRTDALMRAGCSLRARGLDEAGIADALLLLNAGRCVPPLGEAEVEELARDLCQRYPAGRSAAAESLVAVGERSALLAERAYRFRPDPTPPGAVEVPPVPAGFPDPWEGWEAPEGGEGGGASGARGDGASRGGGGEQAAPPDGGAQGAAPARAGVPSRDPAPGAGGLGGGAPVGGAPGGRGGYVEQSVPDASSAGGGGDLAPLPQSVWEASAAERVADGTYPGGEAWEEELHRNDQGAVTKGVRNLVLILLHDRRVCRGARLRFNFMSLYPELGGRQVKDSDVSHLRAEWERHWHLKAGKDLAHEAIRVAAEADPYDPRRAYLGALRWDGRPRIASFAERHFGADRPLYARFMAVFFVGAVKRVYEPGCKFDTVLTLLGPQGYRKSTTFRVLFGEWFSDSGVEPGTREGMLSAAASWGIELGEVEALTLTREDSALKRFLSSAIDTFRRPYASAPEPVPRHSVFVASTNERNGFLRDLTGTGSRRWHVIELTRRVDADELAAERDQLWAEAVHRYRAGERTWLSDGDEVTREEFAADYYQGDPWDDAVPAWCANASNVRLVETHDGARWAVPTRTLLADACGLDARDLNSANQRRLAGVMARLKAHRTRQRFAYGLPPVLAPTPEHGYLLPPSWEVDGETADQRATREAMARHLGHHGDAPFD